MTEQNGSPSKLMKIQYVKKPEAGETLSERFVKESLTRFEGAVGGREKLIEVLESANLDVKQEKLLLLLTNSENNRTSLGAICRMAGMRPGDLLSFFREAKTALAYAEAHSIMADSLPKVVADVAEKSTNHLEPCGCVFTADGSRVPPLPDCPKCAGTGFHYRKSSIEHQQLLLEAIGLLKKGGGVNVQVQQNTGVALGSGFFDKFVKATDHAALDVTDAETEEVI